MKKKYTDDEAKDIVHEMIHRGFIVKRGESYAPDPSFWTQISHVAVGLANGTPPIPDDIIEYEDLLDLILVGAFTRHNVSIKDMSIFIPCVRIFFPDSMESMVNEMQARGLHNAA